MALPNLTRDQAAERAALVTVDNYRIALDLTDGSGKPGERTFRSTTTVTFDALPGSDTVIDIAAETVRGATLNGRALDVSGYDESTGIPLHGLDQHNVVEIDADCYYSNTGEGLHRFVDPVDDEVYLYSQFETADAKRMFACFDQPDLKATFDITVTAPQHWQVVSNGATQSAEAGVHTFATTPKMSTYLVALIAGPYARWDDVYRDEHGEIPLGLFCRASLAEHMDAERLFTETKQGFGFYHSNFGVPYAFGKYDQLFVPEFNAGAMENAGAVTFLEDYVFRSKVTRASYERRAETVLHEMAHMWFGDLVTMRWWDDLWLNESFATFASVLCQSEATEYTSAWTTFANAEKSWAYRQDQLPSTHPIAADIPDLAAVEVNFDGITYAKGASVLKQLVAYVGLDHFLAGLRDYFAAHAFDNATFDDLLAALEKASGRDLSDWGRQWLKTTGLNTLRADFDVDADGRFTRFAVAQSGAAPGAGETRVHRLAIGIYDDEDEARAGSGRLVRVHREELDIEGPSTEVPSLVGVSRGKLILVNDDDLTYCALRLDPQSLATATERIADIAEPLPRTLVWSAAWEMTREAELRARDFVALVQRGIGAETEVGVAQRLLLQAQTALGFYAEPGWAAEHGWPAFADRLLELARGAEPGSDHQLAFVNALCTSVLAERHTAVLAALLDGDSAAQDLAGLAVDTDLRWRIVVALARSGALDSEAIDAEIRRDPTAAGKRQGAQASAARPQPAVKQAAWQEVIEDDTLANITGRAIIAGIVQPGQGELLAPFTARYFEAIRGVWERRSSEVAQTVVVGLYPGWEVSQAGLDAADAFLADPEVPPALRRLVLEGRAGVERSLRARTFDAA
ncbi:aminopeptidase N [Mycolicibacter longobardus]|uniref:Aminopeptidase N n=1 Tax=Mycolicibacter longobardus TaxID=1108812 RepID=A0A1X1YLB9_9MYCO|nr:aminopeptidase N [Mycolicibacter longobardus]MCV7385023.1 aminopeptidase N [Mycolicibacter longobardus]ORW11830.1 aminopeptidase N [Mycolicibacter longobardus]